MDVDGSYTHRKYECLKEAEEQVLIHQIHPLLLLARSIPQVTSGKYYNLCFTFYIV